MVALMSMCEDVPRRSVFIKHTFTQRVPSSLGEDPYEFYGSLLEIKLAQLQQKIPLEAYFNMGLKIVRRLFH